MILKILPDSCNMRFNQLMQVHIFHRWDCLWPIEVFKDAVVAWRCWSCDAITQDPLYVSPLPFLPLSLSLPSNKHAEWKGGRREDTRSVAVGLSVYAPRINAFPDVTLCREGRPNLYPSALRIATSGGSVIRLLCPRRSIFLPLGRFTEPIGVSSFWRLPNKVCVESKCFQLVSLCYGVT